MAFINFNNLYDNQLTLAASVEPKGGLQKITQIVQLVGGLFEGASVDTQYWTSTVGGSGSTTVGSHLATLATGVTANSTVSVTSTKAARFVQGTSNLYLATIRLGDTGATNNLRRWGVGDANNGAFFELSGTTFRICTRKGAADTTVNSGSFNGGNTVTVDTNAHEYAIVYNQDAVWFLQDGLLLHKVTASAATWTNDYHLEVLTENRNSGGGSSNVSIEVRGASIMRCGHVLANPKFAQITSAATTTYKVGPGMLHKVMVTGSGNSTTLTIYDNTAGSGTIIALINCATIGAYIFEVDFMTGLTAVSAGTFGDATLVYE